MTIPIQTRTEMVTSASVNMNMGILTSKACFECAELLIVRLQDLPEQMTLTLIDWEFFSSFRAQHYREL